MSDASQLPSLLRLLEDDSAVVQEAVRQELLALGSELDAVLSHAGVTPSAEQDLRLQSVRAEIARRSVKEAWLAWLQLEDEKEQLESVFNWLNAYQQAGADARQVTHLLDELADDYLRFYPEADCRALARYLFHDRGLHGARDDYFNPANSNLAYVIDARRGLPISLACIYMLVGRRLDLEIGGCNFPGHFLARTTVDGRKVLVDCFNGGRFFEADSVVRVSPESPRGIIEASDEPVPAKIIMLRILNNLSRAYGSIGDEPNRTLMEEILLTLQIELDI